MHARFARLICASLGALAVTAGCKEAPEPVGMTLLADGSVAPEDALSAREDAAEPTAAGSSDAGESPLDASAPSRDAENASRDIDPAPIDSGPPPPVGRPYPAPGAWAANRGPGGPAVPFSASELYVNCAFLDGGSNDVTDHHNLVTMFDGYLLMPWAPEFRRGGLTFFDVSDPCHPAVVGSGHSEEMRETHSIGIANLQGRWFAVVDHMKGLTQGGVQFWDITDVTAPAAVSTLQTRGFFYPDAYARVTLSVAWQVPYVYVAGADNGIFIVDATDPSQPRIAGEYAFEPVFRVGQIIAIGNLLFVSTPEGPRAALLDISDPAHPQPIPGGEFLVRDAMNTPRESYFSNLANGYAFFARKDSGGGVIIYDIRNPTMPTYSGSYTSSANGGYVFVKDNFAFVGESDSAAIYDITSHASISEVARLDLVGDLDTIVPIGNVVVLSVDDDAERDKGSAIAPWQMDIDRTPPRVTWSYPESGATHLPLTSRIGLTFSEFIDPKSAWEGSVRLYESGTDPAVTRVDGYVSAQDVVVNFWPITSLRPNTEYTLEVPAGGVVDFNGNAISAPFAMTFTTVGP